MDAFLKDMKTVADWLIGMLGDLIDIAAEYPFMVIILIAGIGYLVFDHILLLFSGHGTGSGYKAAKTTKFAVKKGQAIGVGKQSPIKSGKHTSKSMKFSGIGGYKSVVGGSKFRKHGQKTRGSMALLARLTGEKQQTDHWKKVLTGSKSGGSDVETSAESNYMDGTTAPPVVDRSVLIERDD